MKNMKSLNVGGNEENRNFPNVPELLQMIDELYSMCPTCDYLSYPPNQTDITEEEYTWDIKL
jgi:hypothetical protein